MRLGNVCYKETAKVYKGYEQRRGCRLEYNAVAAVAEIDDINYLNRLLAPNPTEVFVKKCQNLTTGMFFIFLFSCKYIDLLI